MENWKDIPGYEGLYQISDFGNVRSLPKIWSIGNNGGTGYHDGIILKKILIKGYVVCNLIRDKKIKTFRVHRLVGESFIPNPDNKPCINHKDLNRSNNIIDNLEWCTNLENAIHRKDNGKYSVGKKHHMYKPLINLNSGVFYDTLTEAANAMGMKYSTLSNMVRGKRKNRTPVKWA